MAYFAKLNSENIVTEVISVHNNELLDSNGVEQEANGVNFLIKLTNYSNWKQTSYNGNIRKNYAGIGMTYDEDRDAFIAPKPFNSWILNEDTCRWEAPVAMPTGQLEENQYYSWNEEILSWTLQTI
jgi:hypothetical protein